MDVFSTKRQQSSLTFDPLKSAVLVIDMLNDFCTDGGAMVLPGAEKLYAPQNRVISDFRAAGSPIVFVVDSHRPGLRSDREFLKRTPHCIEGSWGAEVVPELDRQPGDLVVLKRRYSAFFNTDLDLTLKDMQIETLFMMGVVTNICVRSTAHDAFFHGYSVAVLHDCCAATGPREQDSTLYDIATHFGVVTDAASSIDALAGSRSILSIERFENA